MKKTRTVFFNTIAILLPIVLLTNCIILIVAYRVAYKLYYNSCAQTVTKAARVIEDFVGMYDLSDPEDVNECNESMSALCREFEITYAYVVRINADKKSETYVTLGAGKDASERFLQERHPGDTVVGYVNQQQLDVVTGKEESAVLHERSVFDDTITCYVSLKHVYNVEKKTFEEKARTDCVVAAELAFHQMLSEMRSAFNYIVFLTILLSIGLVVAFAMVLKAKISKPAGIISRQMKNFVAGDKDSVEHLEVTSNKEFADMSRSFNTMVDEINQYVGDIEQFNKQKHIQEAEMNIARNIQLGLLPPEAFYNEDVNIDAYVLPARDVGGDLYHYQVLPDGKIAFAVADVSGKGVSAALFVSRALTLLDIYAKLAYSPAKVMEHYNKTLAAQNPGKLFITTFAGIYNPADRSLVYTNAGHNVPYILGKDRLTALDGAACMAAGVFADAEYEEATVTLEEGDIIFVYTDGVNEAENRNGEFFTTERLEAELKAHLGENRRFVIADVLNKVHAFCDGAEQSDDITMFTVKTAGAFYHEQLHLSANVENLVQLNTALEDIPDISQQLRADLNLMAEEIFVNLCSYAYGDAQGMIDICINAAETVEIMFSDSGTPYNPTRNLLDIEEYDHENTVGGLGKFITFNLADDYHYEYKDGKNVLTLIKKVK